MADSQHEMNADRIIKSLATRVRAQRGKLGIRAAARDIGISSATLSRIENAYQIDLRIFVKICEWLGINLYQSLQIDTKERRVYTRRKAMERRSE